MSTLKDCAEIADELLAARDVARRLFGDSYQAKVQPWCAELDLLAGEFGCRVIEVPVRLEREGCLPANPLLMFAAVVELSERRVPAASATANTGDAP